MHWNRSDSSLLRRHALYALTAIAALMAIRVHRSAAPDLSIAGTGRRPLVVVNGTTEQIPIADYISSAGGLSTNGNAAAAGDVQTTTLTTSAAAVGQLDYTVQASTITGTNDNVALNANTTVFRWNGAGIATITGFTGGAAGRILVVNNVTSSLNLTLSNLTGSSAGNQLLLFGNTSEVVKPNGSATFVYDTTAAQWRNVAIASTQINAAMAFNATTITAKNITSSANVSAVNTTGSVSIGAQGPGAHYRAVAGTPLVYTCGSNVGATATDAGGEVTIGTSSGGTCTITFNTPYTTNAPACIVRFHDATTNAAFSYTTSLTQLSITGAADSKTFDFFCIAST